MTQRDFERDGQKFWFETERLIDGFTWRIYRTECAICRKPIRTRGLGSSKMVSRRCSAHGLKGAPVGSKSEAAWIELKGWTVEPGSVVDRMRKEGRAPVIERRKPAKAKPDPRPVKAKAKEPPPRKTVRPKLSKQAMAAARAEKVRRRQAKMAKKSSRD